MKINLTYEEAVAELEKIITDIEGENISIDELSSKVKRATELIEFCKGKLFKTEDDVRKILENLAKM